MNEFCSSTLHSAEMVLAKLASRSFLKLFLKSDDLAVAMAKITEDLQDCVQIFHLKAEIEASAWLEQLASDRERDTQLLLEKIAEAMSDDQKMFHILEVKNDELLETIKTLQRTVDSVVSSRNGTTPGSGRLSKQASITRESRSNSPLGVMGEDDASYAVSTTTTGYERKMSGPGWASVAGLRKQSGGEVSRAEVETGLVYQHVEFLQRGLDVSSRGL